MGKPCSSRSSPRTADATARLVSQDALRAVYECRLRSADSGDRTAGHLVATITIRRPTGVHGVFCNGVRTFDGKDYAKHAKGPGHVLDRFNNSLGSHSAIAAQ